MTVDSYRKTFFIEKKLHPAEQRFSPECGLGRVRFDVTVHELDSGLTSIPH